MQTLPEPKKMKFSDFKDEILKEVGQLNPNLPPALYDKRISEIKIKWFRKLTNQEITLID